MGSGEHYTLQRYLSIGEYDGSQGPEDVYREAMDAIFKEGKDSHRFPQLRWSKRHPGKYRWVLYEMWPLTDPVTQARAVLVCEQNISQVKALEDEIRKQNQRWVLGVSVKKGSLTCLTLSNNCGGRLCHTTVAVMYCDNSTLLHECLHVVEDVPYKP